MFMKKEKSVLKTMVIFYTKWRCSENMAVKAQSNLKNCGICYYLVKVQRRESSRFDEDYFRSH